MFDNNREVCVVLIKLLINSVESLIVYVLFLEFVVVFVKISVEVRINVN